MPFKRTIENQYSLINEKTCITGEDFYEFFRNYTCQPHSHVQFRSNGSRVFMQTELCKELKALFNLYNFDNDAEAYIQNSVNILVNKNRHFRGIKWDLYIYLNEYRKGSVLLLPTAIENHYYLVQEKGLSIDEFEWSGQQNNEERVEIRKYLIENNYDDVFLIKEKYIHGSMQGKLYILYENALYISPINNEKATFFDNSIIDTCINMGKNVNEALFPLSLVAEIEEAFVSNVHEGLMWIQAYKTRRFTNKFSKEITEIINKKNKPAGQN